jgi:hypothetical protein
MLLLVEWALVLGAGGALLGWFVGQRVGGADTTRSETVAYGALVGLVAGAGIDIVLLQDVMDSHSSTATIGVLVLPIPLATNIGTGILSALAGHARRP